MKITSSARKLREDPRRSAVPLRWRRQQRVACADAYQPSAREGRRSRDRRRKSPDPHSILLSQLRNLAYLKSCLETGSLKPPDSTAYFKCGLVWYLPPLAIPQEEKVGAKLNVLHSTHIQPPLSMYPSRRFLHSNINDNNNNDNLIQALRVSEQIKPGTPSATNASV